MSEMNLNTDIPKPARPEEFSCPFLYSMKRQSAMRCPTTVCTLDRVPHAVYALPSGISFRTGPTETTMRGPGKSNKISEIVGPLIQPLPEDVILSLKWP